MSAACTKGVSDTFGNVAVVSDEFQVIQNVVEAYDYLLKAERLADDGNLDRLVRTGRMRRMSRFNWSMHLRMQGHRGRQEPVRQLVRVAAATKR
jgi:hypothetical protein